jgi:hypothetical protein
MMVKTASTTTTAMMVMTATIQATLHRRNNGKTNRMYDNIPAEKGGDNG